LNCFEELISRVNFVKLALKSIYEEWTFTKSIKPSTQQRQKERTKKEDPTKREDPISSQKNETQSGSQRDKVNSIYIDCSKTSILKTRDNLDKVCTTRFVWWVT
jgi:hypothetical protein